MPQQQQLAGYLGSMGNMPYRYRLISLPERRNLGFNTVKLDEYMSQSDIDVAKTKAIGTKKAQADALKYLALHDDQRLIEVLGLSSYHFHD